MATKRLNRTRRPVPDKLTHQQAIALILNDVNHVFASDKERRRAWIRHHAEVQADFPQATLDAERDYGRPWER